MSGSYDGAEQVNYVRIIDRQVNHARIIWSWEDGHGQLMFEPPLPSSGSEKEQTDYLINTTSEDPRSFVLHEGAGCHGPVGSGSGSSAGEKKLLPHPCAGLILIVSIVPGEVDINGHHAHACWPAVDSCISPALKRGAGPD